MAVKKTSPWQRGLLFAAVVGPCAGALPGVLACVSIFTGGDALGFGILTLIWGGSAAAVGFIVGACQPVAQEASASVDGIRRWTVRRCLYVPFPDEMVLGNAWLAESEDSA